MYIAAEKANLSNVLYVSGKTYKQKFELGRLKMLVSGMREVAFTPGQISIYNIDDDSREAVRIEKLQQRHIGSDYSYIKLKGDGRGNIKGVDFGVYDSKPIAVVSMSKDEIDSNDPSDIVKIILTLNRKYTGTIYFEINGPLGSFDKKIIFKDQEVVSFDFHSKFYGHYIFPSMPIDEFQDLESKKLRVSF